MEKVPVQFRVLDEVVSAEVEPMPERIRLDEMLPLLRVLDDQFLGIAIRKNGQPVTCAKGCSACCKIQPVPVTPAEAYGLLLLVEAMPEPRRAEILSRFRDCVASVQAAGLVETYLEGRQAASMEEAKANVQHYLDLQLVCPFLDNDACSIYEIRPFTCREYLVTSPKEFCADPLSFPVKRVPQIVSGGSTMLGTAAGLTGKSGYSIPLTLALVFAERHREALATTYPSLEVVNRSLQTLVASSRQTAH
jgi:Fe-S-cluster containining protein